MDGSLGMVRQDGSSCTAGEFINELICLPELRQILFSLDRRTENRNKDHPSLTPPLLG